MLKYVLTMFRIVVLSGLSISFLLSCNPERVQYTNELKQEMADSKIKRVTDADLVETIDNLGGKVSATIQKELTTALQKTTDPAERTRLCQLKNMPRTKAIAERYVLDIRLLGPADIQDKDISAKEREILSAYFYNAKQKLAPVSNIQKTSDTSFVYNLAVPADSPICESCFGKQDVPFAVWHIGFQKREVIRRMGASIKK
ncbi:hypothetical protein [Spirosoma sp. 48-14]|uniref:hypothetical protein n=2 Tax=unclassified Spirosoma TaxID=2621999 RepID=UPI0009593A25|nr:hypothetical protein [Spirosoma sp. 48-14]OJW78897.1 MAG: hypothetical protein BGO59_10525 [Spirosoma sp. 48-14]